LTIPDFSLNTGKDINWKGFAYTCLVVAILAFLLLTIFSLYSAYKRARGYSYNLAKMETNAARSFADLDKRLNRMDKLQQQIGQPFVIEPSPVEEEPQVVEPIHEEVFYDYEHQCWPQPDDLCI